MTNFTTIFSKEMDKGGIELTCTSMVNILKYVPEVQEVDDAVRPCSLALIPDELKTQKICDPEALKYVLIPL